MVIIHLGGNDSGPLSFPNYNDEYTHWRSLKASGSNAIRPGEKFLIENSNIMRLIYSVWYDKMNYSKEGVFSYTKGIARLNILSVKANVEKNEPTGYKNNLTLLLRNIKMYSCKVIFFNFYGPDSTFLNKGNIEAIKRANYKANLKDLVNVNLKARNKCRKVASDLCAQMNISFAEIPQGGINDTYFNDQCHLNVKGQKVKSDFIFNILEKLD